METNYTNVVLIDKSVKDCHFIESITNVDTFPILYSTTTSKSEIIDILRTTFTTIERFGIMFSFNPSIQLFLDDKPFFDESEQNENVEFILAIIKEFNVKQLDYLSCNTLNDTKWTNYYSILSKTNVIVGASTTKLGSSQYGGDWIMENTQENLESIYFTPQIEEYKHVLDNPYGTWVSLYNNYNTVDYKNYIGLVEVGGFLYVTNIFGDGTITKINIKTKHIDYNWVSGLNKPVGIVEVGGFLYVTNYNTGSISKIEINNKNNIDYNWVSGLNYPYGIVEVGGFLYITNYDTGSISKIEINNKNNIDYNWVSDLIKPSNLATDSVYLYVINKDTVNTDKYIITTIDTTNGSVVHSNFLVGLGNNLIISNLLIIGKIMYITNSANGTIIRINMNNGSILLDMDGSIWSPSGLPNSSAIVNYNDDLYVLNYEGTITKINRLSKPPINSSWIYAIDTPTTIARKDNYMYVRTTQENNRIISKINISNGVIEKVIEDNLYGEALAIHENYMYSGSYDTGVISKINISNSTIISDWVILDVTRIRSFAINKNNMYVLSSIAGGDEFVITKINMNTDPPTINLNWVNVPYDMFFRKIYIINNVMYLTESSIQFSTEKIYTLNLDDNTPIIKEWITGLLNPSGIAVDGNDMYVTNYFIGTISKIDIANRRIVDATWASGFFNPHSIIIYDNYLYVTNKGNGTIDKIRLPPPPPPTPPTQPRRISLGSLYSNNAQVYYKSHSLASGGIGGVRNYRLKSRKT